ncbi:MAG: SH3 domain-containing protein [Leptospiraceae bacterium]|nr:SH3 domain-containing protein [Leptospiraceae bacterium]MCK6380268.1 SH3 domain-containing protein [Leptospiraceae bacterium]NUM41097.1 SH3 domain-containing protein [Leptospiraceae bacterium]
MNNKNLLKKIFALSIVSFFIFNCGTKAEITWNTKVYAEPNINSKVVGELKKGDIVTPSDYLNHERLQKEFIKVKNSKIEGYVSPKFVVINQLPENSVFTWGYKKDYKHFYDPNDKKHYPQGYEWPNLKAISKEKISLDELLKGEKLD